MRHTTRSCFVALLLVLSFGATACASSKAVHADHAGSQAHAAVQDILNAYAHGSFAGFADQVSQDYRPLRAEFLSQADNSRAALQNVQYEFFVDQMLLKGQTMAVMFTWNRKAQTATGQSMTQGRAEFIFTAEDGLWKLIQNKGDNPF